MTHEEVQALLEELQRKRVQSDAEFRSFAQDLERLLKMLDDQITDGVRNRVLSHNDLSLERNANEREHFGCLPLRQNKR